MGGGKEEEEGSLGFGAPNPHSSLCSLREGADFTERTETASSVPQSLLGVVLRALGVITSPRLPTHLTKLVFPVFSMRKLKL